MKKHDIKCADCGADDVISPVTRHRHLNKYGRILCKTCTHKLISVSSLALWNDEGYRKSVELKSADQKHSPARSERMCKKWQEESYRSSMLSVYASPEYKHRMSKAIIDKWHDKEYRSKIIEFWSNHVSRELLSVLIKEKWADDAYRSAVIARYSDINVIKQISQRSSSLWASDEYRDKVIASIKKRWEDFEFKIRMAYVRSKNPKISQQQLILYNLLEDLHIDFEREGINTTIGYYVFDCLVHKSDNTKLLIECQGDYWHNRPKQQVRDTQKFTYIDRYFPNYTIMYIWEHEFSTHERVLGRLKAQLGIEIESVSFDFANVEIRQPTMQLVKEFLNSYHYIGRGRGGIVYGAYYNNILIACIVYSRPLRQNIAASFGVKDDRMREISRLCIHPSYHKKNFASWFIANSLHQIDADLIIAYADQTAGHRGTVYKSVNFQLHHKIKPDYWYVDNDGYVMHKRTLYGKAKQMQMTEKQYAETYKYSKKYGGPKLCYIKWHNNRNPPRIVISTEK